MPSTPKRRDELSRALRQHKQRAAQFGFAMVGSRNLHRVQVDILNVVNFQMSAGGSGDFCVNVAAFTMSGNNAATLQPGFRLRREDGAEMWLPSFTEQKAMTSVDTAWRAIELQALPWLEQNSTLQGHLAVLQRENWGSEHHRRFQIAIVEGLLGRPQEAIASLSTAIRLYTDDGRNWCAAYIERAEALIDALKAGTALTVLDQWRSENYSI